MNANERKYFSGFEGSYQNTLISLPWIFKQTGIMCISQFFSESSSHVTAPDQNNKCAYLRDAQGYANAVSAGCA